jgi:cell shape-determining protein MreC
MQYQYINDEIIIAQFLQMFKNIFMNIFIFILCIFLFFNPVLLVNVLLFISIYLFVRSSLTFFSEDNNTPQQFDTEIKINFDESELLKDRIRHLKKENTMLKDRIERSERKHKKREKIPLFRAEKTTKPFKINVDFPEIDTTENIEIKQENEIVNDDVEQEAALVHDEIKEEHDERKVHSEIDFDKIISDVITEMINNSESLKDDGFAILSKTPNNSEEHSSEEDYEDQ